jgi:hypothetical protein
MAGRGFQYSTLVPSMYERLDDQSIAHIENAVWLGELGFYKRAIDVFETKLANMMMVPVVVFEKHNILVAQGRVRDAYNIVSDFIQNLGSDEVDLPQNRLLALALALGELRHHGTIEGPVRELNRTREWLKDTPVRLYTDVHVSGLSAPKHANTT